MGAIAPAKVPKPKRAKRRGDGGFSVYRRGGVVQPKQGKQ